MDSKQIRPTFTTPDTKPVYGLPVHRPDSTGKPRGSVRSLAQMYENKVREILQEPEKIPVKTLPSTQLSQEKLNIYENKHIKNSLEPEIRSQRESSNERPSQDKPQPFLSINLKDEVLREEIKNQMREDSMERVKDFSKSEKNKQEEFKVVGLDERIEDDRVEKRGKGDKRVPKKIGLRLGELWLDRIDEKSEVDEKSVLDEKKNGKGEGEEDCERGEKYTGKDFGEKYKEEFIDEHGNLVGGKYCAEKKNYESKILEGQEERLEIKPDFENANKKSREKSKNKSKKAESVPESEELIMNLNSDTKVLAYQDELLYANQEAVSYPPYIEQPFNKNPEVTEPDPVIKEILENPELTQNPVLKENKDSQSRKKSKKNSQKSKELESFQRIPETKTSNPFFQSPPGTEPTDLSPKIAPSHTPISFLSPALKNLPTNSVNISQKLTVFTSKLLNNPNQLISTPQPSLPPTYQEPTESLFPTSPILSIPSIPSDLSSPYNSFSYKKAQNLPQDPPKRPFASPTLTPKRSSLTLQLPDLRSESKQLMQEIDITCINCYECLRPEDIDTHSQKCLKPNLEVTESMQADIRIKKMLKSISIHKLESSGQKFSLYSQLEEYSLAILEKTMSSDSISDKLQEIFSQSLILKDGLPITVLSKRLENLLELKGEFTTDQPEKDILKLYEQETQRQRKELEKWKMRSELLLQLAGNPAGTLDVNSDISSCRNSVISFDTGFSDYPNDVANLEDIESVLHSISEEDLEKHFYTVCIRAKLTLAKTHPYASVPVFDLFKEVQREKIPVSQWRDYLNEKFHRHS